MIYDKSEAFKGNDALASHAQGMAAELAPDGFCRGRDEAARIRQSLRALQRAEAELSRRWPASRPAPGAVRWLLDNAYIARREGLEAAEAFAGAKKLPAHGERAAALLACREFLSCSRFEADETRLELFLQGWQREHELSRRELELLGAGFRAVLLFKLCDLAKGLQAGEGDVCESEVKAVITSLSALAGADFTELISRADSAERLLMSDPAGIYPLMDRESRGYYRERLDALARGRGITARQAAERVLSLAVEGSGKAGHVGYWILLCPLGEGEKIRSGAGYIAVLAVLTLGISALAGIMMKSAAAALLLLLPISELVKTLTDLVFSRMLPKSHLPCLRLESGVPDEGRTLCTVSAIVSDEASAEKLSKNLEQARLLSRDCGKNLMFAIAADLPDTGREHEPEAERALELLCERIDRLNAQYSGGFFVLSRERASIGGRYMGWERKRGALTETMRFLRGEEGSVSCHAGDAGMLKNVKFLLALDSDTRLTPGVAQKLIGAMLHPLNRPVVDEKARCVKSGFGIIAPRMSVTLPDAAKSDFARIFAGAGGCSPYGGECGEISMKLCSLGGFSGKGIIDIDAYLACMEGRIPENRVLSHDTLEGAYLRCGCMGGAELLDGFPSNALSYYRRMHRWVRGDWQNLPWLFGRGGELPAIEKFRIFDKLRQSLLPGATLLALCAGFFIPCGGLAFAAAAALIACLSQLFLCAAEGLFRDESEARLRYHSKHLSGFGGGLAVAAVKLMLLPVEAQFCLDATFRALWRMLISHKRLLQWQTSMQSDGARSGIFKMYASMLPAAVLGLALAILAPSIIGRAAGIIWLLSPCLAAILSVPDSCAPKLSDSGKEYLLGHVGEMWRYFESFMTEEENFLPPDNYQAQPPVGAAHRTSPTNIGLALLSAVSAHELGFISRCELTRLISGCLDTAEALEKQGGHLYNWYDTQTLRPLSPRYISTVDSGNLCACLIAVKGALLSYGCTELAERAEGLISAMDFALLYDRKKHLFTIGIDAKSGEMTRSWYDLMESEARLTAYVAISRGAVPARIWRRMSRAQVQKNGYRGMVSWTGTMFEYLMPELLLPLFNDSLLYESAEFCLYVQKKRALAAGRPWGISESAFYSLDPSMSYRYKAHGCAELALRRGMDDELVVSPYSSFLALCLHPAQAVKNLRRLEKMGLRGPFGMWEAADFTRAGKNSERPDIVRCVMSHHLGMSIVAAANCLTGGKIVDFFMSDPEMSAHVCLLQEKIPDGGRLLRRRQQLNYPEKRTRIFCSWEKRGFTQFELIPECCMLSGMAYGLVMTETGDSIPAWGEISPYLTGEMCGMGHGIDIFMRLGSLKIPLLPEKGANAEFSWHFTPEIAAIHAENKIFSSTVTAMTARDEPGELRRISLSFKSGEKTQDEPETLNFRLSPILARERDYRAHPAFCKLGLSAKTKNGRLIIRRLARGGTEEMYLCLACDRPADFFSVPGADSARAAAPVHLGENEYFMTEPLMECRVCIERGANQAVCFSLYAAKTENEAYLGAERCLFLGEDEAGDLPRRAAAVIGMDRAGFESAVSLIPGLCFPGPPLPGGGNRGELWKFGVSGDLPIVCAEFDDLSLIPAARELMDSHLLLCGCGINFDLVFITHDEDGYRRPLDSALEELLWRNGGDALSGAKGGVHIIDSAAGAQGIRACAAIRAELSGKKEKQKRHLRNLPTPIPEPEPGPEPEYVWEEDGVFSFTVGGRLPRKMWTSPLTNGRLSFIAADCGSGGMWYLNSRENPICPWRGQPTAFRGPETLELETGAGKASLFAGGTPCRVRFGFGFAEWESKIGMNSIRVTAFVPPEADARVFIVEPLGGGFEGTLCWRLELQLAPEPGDARFVITSERGGVLTAENPRAFASAKPFSAVSWPMAESFNCCAASKDPDGKTGASAQSVFSMRIRPENVCIIVCGCETPKMLLALAEPERAKAELEKTKAWWCRALGALRVRTPSVGLNRLINGWAAYQALACRVMARGSVYQNGGAFGFRDQLQDTVNLIPFAPELARGQILRSCTRQYIQGDVQHWWHEGASEIRGVRTRCSDDLLWLVWALCEYVEKTGDEAICFEKRPYLKSAELSPDEGDRYESAETTTECETVLTHCRRALDRILERGTGAHGLLLIGSGDWNDGFDNVRGESQWLTWFFCGVAPRFAALSERFEPGIGKKYRDWSQRLLSSAEKAWNGKWYLRGYYADGKPLGAAGSSECEIDSIAQSFAAFCPGSDFLRVKTALKSAYERLFDRKSGVVKLFTPPFSGIGRNPGYIRSYGPGFRENGGQYTHGAIWLASVMLQSGMADEGWELLRALLPSEKDAQIYGGEPYVVAADVYSAPGHEGEAGWTWYTGSAGWLLRTVTEDLLGLKMKNGRLCVSPKLPKSWSGYSADFMGRQIEVGSDGIKIDGKSPNAGELEV